VKREEGGKCLFSCMLRYGDNRHGEGRAKSFHRHIVSPSHCIAAMVSIASDKCWGQKDWVDNEARIFCRQDNSPLICNTVSTTSLHTLHNFFLQGGGNQEENCVTFFEIVESVLGRI